MYLGVFARLEADGYKIRVGEGGWQVIITDFDLDEVKVTTLLRASLIRYQGMIAALARYCPGKTADELLAALWKGCSIHFGRMIERLSWSVTRYVNVAIG